MSKPITILSSEDLMERHYTHDITQKSFGAMTPITPSSMPINSLTSNTPNTPNTLLSPSKPGFLAFLKHSLTPNSQSIPIPIPIQVQVPTITTTSSSTSTSTPSSLSSIPKLSQIIKKKNKENEKYRNKLYFPNSYNLHSSNLYTIPDSVFSLRNLVQLNISNNQITKIPPEISQLTLLEELYIDRNLIETLPLEIIQLTKITNLSISNNPIKYDLLHPLIVRYLRMINWGKKYIVQEIQLLNQKINQSPDKKIEDQKEFLLKRKLDSINSILDKKTKRSIKTMIFHNKMQYLDIINFTKECPNIQPNCKINIENFITKFGSELYCIIRNCTKIVSYYDHFEKCDVIKTIKLDKKSTAGQIITFCTVLEYFYNFTNASAHQLTIYQMFNSAFSTDSKINSLNELMFTFVNILNGFDPYVDLTINLSKN